MHAQIAHLRMCMRKLRTCTPTMNLLIPSLFCIHDAAKLFNIRFLEKYLRSVSDQDSPSNKGKCIDRTCLLLTRETPFIDSINQRPRKLALELQRWTSGRCSLRHFYLIVPSVLAYHLTRCLYVVAHAVTLYKVCVSLTPSVV